VHQETTRKTPEEVKQLAQIKEFFKGLDTFCKLCNYAQNKCICSLCTTGVKIITNIEQRRVKRKKFITILHGNITKNEFKQIKDHVGTGGKYIEGKIQLRGRMSEKIRKVLESLNYKFNLDFSTI